MEQEELWYDSGEQACDAAILKSGKKAKEIANALWPGMKMDSAYARLKNALNADKAEKLTLDEIIHICRLTGHYDPLFYMADELSHTRPTYRSAKDQEAQLATEAARLASQVGRLMDRLDKINARKVEVDEKPRMKAV